MAYREAVDIQAERISDEWIARKEPRTSPEVEGNGTSTSSLWSMSGCSDDATDDTETTPPSKTDAIGVRHIEVPLSERGPSTTASAESRARTTITLTVAFLIRNATLLM